MEGAFLRVDGKNRMIFMLDRQIKIASNREITFQFAYLLATFSTLSWAILIARLPVGLIALSSPLRTIR